MPKLLAVILLAGVLHAQTSVPETKDPLGRTTPQDSVFHFLEACHARDYSKALHYLDLRRMPPAERARNGAELARQLEDLLDDTPFDITTLSRDPEGDQSDGLSSGLDRLDTFRVDGQTLELQLERVELKPGFHSMEPGLHAVWAEPGGADPGRAGPGSADPGRAKRPSGSGSTRPSATSPSRARASCARPGQTASKSARLTGSPAARSTASSRPRHCRSVPS